MMKLNTATKVTVARMLLLPFILFFYISAHIFDVEFFKAWGKLIALILFAIAAATDWLDGYIARKYNQVSNIGKLLDPVADKMLMVLGFILLLTDPLLTSMGQAWFPYWFGVLTIFLMLGRDFLMDSLRLVASQQGIVIAADRLGKLKTLAQILALVMYMFLAFNLSLLRTVYDAIIPLNSVWIDVFGYLSLTMLAIATLFSIYSCVNYIRNYIISFKEKEKATKEKTNGTSDSSVRTDNTGNADTESR